MLKRLDYIWQEQAAVSSIEYALLASLIGVIISLSVLAVGQRTQALWLKVEKCVVYAVQKSGSCP